MFDPTGRCPDCGRGPGETEFYAGREKRCKPCYRVHLREGYAHKREALDALKLARGCADCGYRAHAVALDFDHLPEAEKSFNLAEVQNYSLGELLHEAGKCEVVCANCHRIRTAKREAASREGPQQVSTRNPRQPRQLGLI